MVITRTTVMTRTRIVPLLTMTVMMILGGMIPNHYGDNDRTKMFYSATAIHTNMHRCTKYKGTREGHIEASTSDLIKISIRSIGR